jgi:large subunit ribosomal protein L32
MAVPQGRTTRSKRGMRRAHDSLKAPTLAVNAKTGETHRRHHISKLVRLLSSMTKTTMKSKLSCQL